MNNGLVHIGFGNMVAENSIVAVVTSGSAPTKRLIANKKEQGLLIDATSGKQTKSAIIANSGHIILSALSPETIAKRIQGEVDIK